MDIDTLPSIYRFSGIQIYVAAVGSNLLEGSLQSYTSTDRIFKSPTYTEALQKQVIEAICKGIKILLGLKFYVEFPRFPYILLNR